MSQVEDEEPYAWQHTDLSSRLAHMRLGDDEVRRIELSAPLPCGMPDCGRPTSSALVEPDVELPGIWMLLPLCAACAGASHAEAAHSYPGLKSPLAHGQAGETERGLARPSPREARGRARSA